MNIEQFQTIEDVENMIGFILEEINKSDTPELVELEYQELNNQLIAKLETLKGQ